MMSQRLAIRPVVAAIRRLNALSSLDIRALNALDAAVDRPRLFRARREILSNGQEIAQPLLILDGWAARQQILEDGRRQITDFLLPGDLIGCSEHDRPVSLTSVVALTDVDACAAPDSAISPGLARAYALSRSSREAYLLAQVVRIGRMNAQDRIADLLLELLDRLDAAGLAENGRFFMPLTQEMIADAVGLTSVHVNRTLQSLRKAGAIDLKGRALFIAKPAALRRTVGRAAAHVTAVSYRDSSD